MKKLLLILVALAIGAAVCPQAKAQGGQRAATARNAMGLAVPSANVTVCTYSAGSYALENGVWTYTGTVPCTTPTAVYADPGLTHLITQPVLTGGNGNYAYYMAASTEVTECVTGTQVVSSCYAVVVGGGSGGGGGGGGSGACAQTSVQSGQVCAGPYPGFASLIQTNAAAWSYSSGSSFTETLAYSQPVAAGQVLFVVEMGDYLAYPNGALPPPSGTVTDSLGNTFSYVNGSDVQDSGHRSAHAQVFTATAATAGTDTITGHFTTVNHALFIATLSSLGALDVTGQGGQATADNSAATPWTGSISTVHPDVILGVVDMVACCSQATNTLTDTSWNVLSPGIVAHAGATVPSQFYGVEKYEANSGTYTIGFASYDTWNVFANGVGAYLWAFQSASQSSGVPLFRQLAYSDLPNNGNLVLTQTPLTNAGDLMTDTGGVLSRLGLGSSRTYLGNCGSVLGYCAPALAPGTLSSWGTCSTANQGLLAAVSDSTTNTQGAIITGGGSTPVLGYCNGANWVVASGSGSGSGGSVTSVGLSLPAFFSIANSPVTTTGTLTGTYATGLTSNENNVLGVNASGAAGLYGISSLIQGLSNCNTSGYVYTPQGNDCVPQVGTVSLNNLNGGSAPSGQTYDFTSAAGLIVPTIAGSAPPGKSIAYDTTYNNYTCFVPGLGFGCMFPVIDVATFGVPLGGASSGQLLGFKNNSTSGPVDDSGTMVPEPLIVGGFNGTYTLTLGGTFSANRTITAPDANGTILFQANPFGYQDVTEIATPANPASGVERWFANVNTHTFSCITATGTSCAPTGSGGGVTSFSGDGALITNSGSAGAVTVALGATGVSYGVWGGVASTSGAPAYHSLSSYPSAAFPTLNQPTTADSGGITGCAPSSAGTLIYWNGSVYACFAGNNSGTNYLSENASGVPAWAASPTITLQTIETNNSSQSLLDFDASTTNSIGGVLTPSNPSGGGKEKFELTGTINATGGGLGVSNPTAHSLPITEGSSAVNLLTSPSSNGNCVVSFNVTASAGVDPACALAGVPWNSQSSGYTVAYTDRAGEVPFTGSSASAYTIPVHTTAGFGSNFIFAAPNFGTATLTLSPTTDTIDGGSTQSVFANWDAVLYSDSSGNWHTVRLPMFGAFPSCSGSSNALSFNTSTGVIGCNTIAGGTAILASLQEASNTAITSAGNYLQQTYDSTLTSSYSGSGTSGSPYVWTLKVNQANAFTWTAAHIFSVAGAASTPGVSVTGAPYTGGTATTNFPQLYLNDGTGPTTFSANGTEFGENAPSGFTGNLLDFHINGGASVAKLDYQGNLTVASCSGCFPIQTNSTNNTSQAGLNLLTSTANAVGLTVTPTNSATNQEKFEVTGSYNGSIGAASQLPSGIFTCTEVWGGTGTSNALQSGDDALMNNKCYNDSGSTRTITAVKCVTDVASNTTTVNPTFGSAGTGTTILSAALTCGSSYSYSSSGTITNASWTTGTGIDPAMGGTLTGTQVGLLVEYHY